MGVVIILTGVYLIIEGVITQGGLIAAYLLSSRAMGPVSQAAALLAQFHHAETAKNAIDDIMSLPSETGRNKQIKNNVVLKGNIDASQLCFKYPDETVLALKDISFSIKQGEHVAIFCQCYRVLRSARNLYDSNPVNWFIHSALSAFDNSVSFV